MVRRGLSTRRQVPSEQCPLPRQNLSPETARRCPLAEHPAHLVRSRSRGGRLKAAPTQQLADRGAHAEQREHEASHEGPSWPRDGMLSRSAALDLEGHMAEPWLDRPERAALVLFQKFEVTRPGGYLTLADFLDHADFVGLSRGELTSGIHGLVRRGFVRPMRVPQKAFALTEAGAEAL